MRAKKDATASTTAAELPTNPPTSVVSDALSPNTHPPHDGDGGAADVGGVVGHQTRDIDYTRLNGGPISTEVLEAAGAAGVSDADMCTVDDSKDWTEESAKRTNPSPAVARLMHIKEQVEKRLKACREYLEKLPEGPDHAQQERQRRVEHVSRHLSDDELNSKVKRLRESALNAPAVFKFDPSDQTTLEVGRYFSDTGITTGPAPMKDERRPATIKSCNDIDRKANAHLLRDFERRLVEDPRLSEHSDDIDYSCDEPPPQRLRQSTSSTPHCRNTKSRRPRPHRRVS
jgi:hypothetical protein